MRMTPFSGALLGLFVILAASSQARADDKVASPRFDADFLATLVKVAGDPSLVPISESDAKKFPKQIKCGENEQVVILDKLNTTTPVRKNASFTKQGNPRNMITNGTFVSQDAREVYVSTDLTGPLRGLVFNPADLAKVATNQVPSIVAVEIRGPISVARPGDTGTLVQCANNAK